MRNSPATTAFAITAILLCNARCAQADAPPLLKQLRNGPAGQLTAAELAELGDPFFNLVLKDHPNAVTLEDVDELLRGSTAKRRLFVVHEQIADADRHGFRRCVIDFTGRNGDEVLDTNVMLSVFFDADGVDSEIESWGWDSHRGRYNYYRLDRNGTPDSAMRWKFRGSSNGADLLSVSDRVGTCFACHTNGEPVMKELLFPWNNWHSDAFRPGYLQLTTPADQRWPIVSRFPFHEETVPAADRNRLQSAESLERAVIAAIHQFNRRRINRALARREDDGSIEIRDGFQQVREGRRLVRHLFTTTQINLISSKTKSGLHPLLQPSNNGPSADVQIPNSFFLNSNLLAGEGSALSYRGLGLSRALDFTVAATLSKDEYRNVIHESGVQIVRKPGDAVFSWFVPEPSHVDNDMVDQLMRRGIATPEFVAAAMAIDLETPVFSKSRASLLQFIPQEWQFEPLQPTQSHLQLSRHPDKLTLAVIQNIEAAQPEPESAAARFLALLELDDPLAELRQAVEQYHDRMETTLAGSGRAAEVKRLYKRAIAFREAMLQDPLLKSLDETGGQDLLPRP